MDSPDHLPELISAAKAAKRLGFAATIDLCRAFYAAGLTVYQPTPHVRSRKVSIEDCRTYLKSIARRKHAPSSPRPRDEREERTA